MVVGTLEPSINEKDLETLILDSRMFDIDTWITRLGKLLKMVLPNS